MVTLALTFVANPSGGFLGFLWHFQGDDECKQYLQLEEGKLCFKIRVENEADRKYLRKKWYSIIQSEGKKQGLKLNKPSRFGSGKYMTICIFEGEYREIKSGEIDIKKTIELLRKAEKILKSVHENA